MLTVIFNITFFVGEAGSFKIIFCGKILLMDYRQISLLILRVSNRMN